MEKTHGLILVLWVWVPGVYVHNYVYTLLSCNELVLLYLWKLLIKGSQESERTVTGIKKVTVTVTYEGGLNAGIGSSNFFSTLWISNFPTVIIYSNL